jgi:hypothetical protein
MSSKTISDDYLNEQKKLHENPNYGVASTKFAATVADLIGKAKCTSVTDYGAGKKRLWETLKQLGATENITYQPFDPAFPDYGQPLPADLVCCIDVLEHIEPELLNNVLAELASLITKIGFFTIHQGPAAKTLSDGRNAHLIQQPSSWWLPRLSQYFEVAFLQRHQVFGHGIMVVVEPKKTK